MHPCVAMRLRTSTEGFRAALLVAIAGTACGGTTRSDDGHPTNAGGGDTDNTSGGASSGGADSGGGSSGGDSAGGRASGGYAGASTGGRLPTNDPRYTTCNNPTAIQPTGGFERCDTGVVHRKAVSDCPSSIDPNASPPMKSTNDACTKNSDCTAQPHGYCEIPFQPGALPGAAKCSYGCVRDSECGPDAVCFCGSPVGTCLSATCKADADCTDRLMCVETSFGNFSCTPYSRFHCGPLCVTDTDCDPLRSSAPMKSVEGNCSEQGPACGRPFLVHGRARSALPERRRDWIDTATPDVDGLSPAARDRLAAHYTEIALMEHASVAAFARFALELLAMGAPADLLTLAGEAMQDEARHARVCFGLASAYAGRDIGPGPLPIDGALESSTLEERILTAFAETCLGETAAALEVAEGARHAADTVVATLLHAIAEDEMRHAALGFRFVKWALGSLPADRRRDVERRMEELLAHQVRAAASRSASAGQDAALARHGLLSEEMLQHVRRAALSDVVVPCVRRLLRGERAPELVALA